MKPAPFDYVRPESLDGALAALAAAAAARRRCSPAARASCPRSTCACSARRCSSTSTESRGSTSVATRGRRAAGRRDCASGRPPSSAHTRLLAAVLPHVGHTVTRNRGTVNGSIAHADAAAELPLALVAFGGTAVVCLDTGTPRDPRRELFLGPYTTALEPDELLVETVWPTPARGEGFAFEELAQRGGDYALCMAAARVRADELRVVVGSVTPDSDRARGRPGAARASRRRSRSSRGARSTPRPTTSVSSCASSSTASSRGRGSEPRDRRRRHGERPPLPRGGRASPAPLRLPPPPPRPHRNARGLRARRLRRVHGEARRLGRPLVPPPRRPGRRRGARDRRGPRRRRCADAAPGWRSTGTTRSSAASAHPGILIAAEDLLSRGEHADAGGDRRHALRPALPLHRLYADRRRDRGGRGRREPRAQPPLRGRAHARCGGARRRDDAADVRRDYASARRGSPRASPPGASRGRPSRLRPRERRRDGRALLGLPVARRVRRAALAPPRRDRPRLLHRRLRSRGRHPRPRRGAGARRRPTSTRARSTSTSASPRSSSTPREPPGARRVSRARIAPSVPAGSRRCSTTGSARVIARSASCRSTTRWESTRCSPPRSSAAASSRSPRGIRSRRCVLIERRAHRHPLPRPHPLLRPRPPPALRRTSTRSTVRAVAYAGSPMTSALVERVAEAFQPEIFVNHYGSTEIYTFSVQRDQRAKPGCAGRAALNARLRLDPPGEGEVLCHMTLRRGVHRLLEPAGRGREGDPRRLVLTPATSAESTRTATSGSSGASTTWSSRAARTSIRSRSRTCSRGRPASARLRWSARRTTAGANGWSAYVVAEERRDRGASSTRTASPRTRSPASSVRASTASSPSSRRARLGRSSGACCGTRHDRARRLPRRARRQRAASRRSRSTSRASSTACRWLRATSCAASSRSSTATTPSASSSSPVRERRSPRVATFPGSCSGRRGTSRGWRTTSPRRSAARSR